MKCKNCGYKLEKGQRECPRCGTTFDMKKEKKKKIGTAAGAVAGITGAGAIVADAISAGKEIKEEQTIKNELSIQWNEKPEDTLIPPNLSLTTGDAKTPDDIKVTSDAISSVGGTMSEEQLRQLLYGSGLTAEETQKLLEAYRTGNADIFNKAVQQFNNSYSETALMNELRSKGLNEDQITRVLDAYKSGNQNQIYNILNEGVQIDPLKSEAEIRAALAGQGLSESDIDKVVAAAQTGGMNEANRVLAEMGEQYAKAYEQALIDELKSQGLNDEQAARVLAAYTSGDQEQMNSLMNEIAVSQMMSSREEMAASLSQYGFTEEEIDRVFNAAQTGGVEEANNVMMEISNQHAVEAETNIVADLKSQGLSDDEISRVMDAYKSGDQEKLNAVLSDINAQQIVNQENNMRDTLSQYGFSEEEINKVIDSARSGGEEAANQTITEIANQRAAEAEANIVAELKEQGFTNEEVDRFLEAYKTGNQENVDAVLNDISNERMMQQEQEIRTSLSEYGFSDEEIDKVIAAARNGGANEANQTIQKISEQHMNDQLAKIEGELRENGLTEDEISQVISAYKTGDQETIEATLDDISNRHFEASVEEMKASLAEAGLTEEEIATVESALRDGGNEAAQAALDEINNQRMDEYEQEIRGNLAEAGVDDETIERMVAAFRDGNKEEMEAIYKEINDKRIAELRQSLIEQGIKKEYIEAIVEAYKNQDQDTINAIYAKIQEEATAKAMAEAEAKFIEQLHEYGINNPEDIEKALKAYRTGKQDELNNAINEILGVIAGKISDGNVAIHPSHIEILLALIGSGEMFHGGSVTDISTGSGDSAVGFDNLSRTITRIVNEVQSGKFNQYDVSGTSEFGDVSFPGTSFSSTWADYSAFLETLKQDLYSIRTVLINMEGSIENYYNSVNMDIGMDMVNNPSEFFDGLAAMGISEYDSDGNGIFDQIGDQNGFANGVFSQLAEYADDGFLEDDQYDPTKLQMFGENADPAKPYSDEQLQAYERNASLIAFLINQASIQGLIDLDAHYNVEAQETYGDFFEAQFNEQCYNQDGSLKFDYSPEEYNHQLLATAVFQNEYQKSIDQGFDTLLYEDFVRGMFVEIGYDSKNGTYPNYEIPTDSFVYTILRMASMKESFDGVTGNSLWRLDRNDPRYLELAREFNAHPYDYESFTGFLADHGYGRARSILGNEVVDLFSHVVTFNNMSDGDRLERSISYGSNWEEAFYYSWQYNDVVGPEFNRALDAYTSFDINNPDRVLRLSDQSPEVIARLHDIYPEVIDENGRVIGDLATVVNSEDLDDDAQVMVDTYITYAIIQADLSLQNDRYTQLVQEMNAFYTFVAPEYSPVIDPETGKTTYEVKPYQQQGIDLFLQLADGNADIGEYLEHQIISYDKFEPSEQFPDYASFCYATRDKRGEGRFYQGVMDYFAGKAADPSIENPLSVGEYYNNFNDQVIKLASQSAMINASCFYSKLQLELNYKKQSGWDKAWNFLMYCGYCLAAGNAGQCGNVDAQNTCLDSAIECLDNVRVYGNLQNFFSSQSLTTQGVINQLTYQNIQYVTSLSYYDELRAQGAQHFAGIHLNPDYYKAGLTDEDGNPIEASRWVDADGNPVPPEEVAVIALILEESGHKVDSSAIDDETKSYMDKLRLLNVDSNNINYEEVLGFLMFSWACDHQDADSDRFTTGEFNRQLEVYANLGFDLEARRRADEYRESQAGKIFSAYLNGEITDPNLLQGAALGYAIFAGGEWLLEDVIFPAIHGVVGFGHSLENLFIDTGRVIFGTVQDHAYDYNPSLSDQTWAYIIQGYKDNGGAQMINYYVTQAMISLGNQAIPIAVSCIPGLQGAGMVLLGASAYGNTLHSTLGNYLQLGSFNEDGTFEWAQGRTPWNAAGYAVLDALSEVYLERFLGGMPGLSDAVRVGIGGFAMDILSEMLEESTQELIGPILEDIATGDLRRAIMDGRLGDHVVDFLGNRIDTDAILDAAIIAAISSGFMNGIQSGPDIVNSLILTDGKSSSLLQLLKLDAQAMKNSGFTAEQIQQQYALNLQGALANVDMLRQIESNLLSSPTFQTEYESWKQGLRDGDPRSELNIRDYAKLRAIQEVSFDTTELQSRVNFNNNKISMLQNALAGDTTAIQQLQKLYKISGTTAIMAEINALNEQNVTLSQQIQEYRLKAQTTFNTNTETINQLQSDLKALNEQLKTCTEEERSSIRAQINEKTIQMNRLTTQNSIINLTLNENVNTLEAQIAQNEKVLSQLRESVNNSELSQDIIDVLNNQIKIIEAQQTDLNNRLGPAREALAQQLTQRESQLITGIVQFEALNEKLNKENATPKEKENYEQNVETINKLKEELEVVQSQIADLEEKGVKVEGRTTAEGALTVIENMQKILEEHLQQNIAAMGERTGSQGQNRITINNETRVQFTKQMSLVITPILMQIGFNPTNMIRTDGTLNQNMGPSCGRILEILRGKNGELTIKMDSTVETDTDTRTDIQSQIDSNSEVISNLTSLMAQFGIDENSPLTSLMEMMQFEKMQLEEMRHASEGIELNGYISHEDAMLEVKWSIENILSSDMSNLEKFDALNKALSEIVTECGDNQVLYDLLDIDSLGGIQLKTKLDASEILSFLQTFNTENIQKIFDTSTSIFERAEAITQLLARTRLSTEECKQITIEGLTIDGRAVKSFNLFDYISMTEQVKAKLEYDIVNSPVGHYDTTQMLTRLSGLTEAQTSDFYKMSDIIRSIKEIGKGNITTEIAKLSEFILRNQDLIADVETKAKLARGIDTLTNNEILKLATNIVGNMKTTMIRDGVGLLTRTQTSDGRVTINIYGTDTVLGKKLQARFEQLYKSLPELAKAGLKEVNLFADFRNPLDDYWAVNYEGDINKNFVSTATGGFGQINLWLLGRNPAGLNIETLCHESGHNIDAMIAEQLFNGHYEFWTGLKSDWQQAKNADGVKVSDYGENALVEDFAESYMRFVLDQKAFVRECPNRAKLLSQMLQQLNSKLNAQNAATVNPTQTVQTAPSVITGVTELQGRVVSELNEVLNAENANVRGVIDLIGKYSVEEVAALLQNTGAIATDTALGRVLQLGLQFYEEGHITAETKYKEFYENFRDHGFQHALAVAKYAESLIKTGMNINTETALLAALMHDLGMTGESGTQGYINLKDGKVAKVLNKALSKYEQYFSEEQRTKLAELDLGNREAISMEVLHEIANWDITMPDGKTAKFINNFQFSMNIARSMHPLNSAMYIMEYFYNELGADAAARVAVLAMSHSKSTSGIKSFANIAQWNKCLTTLENTLEERFGKESIEYQERYNALESLREEIKSPEAFARLVNEAFLVREGDAMADVVMFGENILMQNGIFSKIQYLLEATRENFKIFDTLEEEAQTYRDIRNDGTEVTNEVSKAIHAGELNTKYNSRVTIDEAGNLLTYLGEVILRNAYAVPLGTWSHSIEERLGELNTYTNMGERGFTIWLPSDASQELIDYYNGKIKSWVEEQIASIPSNMEEELVERQKAFYKNIKVGFIDASVYERTDLSIEEKLAYSEGVQTPSVQTLAPRQATPSVVDVATSARVMLDSILDTSVDINNIGITSATINEVLSTLSIEEQMSMFDAIYSRLAQGQVFDNATFKAIFTSQVFNADNDFAKTYLHHFLETLTPGDTTLADVVSTIYDQARKSTIDQELSDLYSYCDHTEAHTLQVAFLTLKALNSISEEARITGNRQYLTMTEANYKEMFVAGLLHDLGMAAGAIVNNTELLQGVNGYLRIVNGIVEIVADDIDFTSTGLAGTIRENHTLNSALAILGLREQLESAGINADILAMVCFSHSKSNSGVGILTESSDWALCIEKIQKAVETHNKHEGATQLTFNLENIGRYDGTTVETTSDQKIKTPKSKAKAIVKNVVYSQNFIEAMATKAFALRVGDAFVSKAKITLKTPITWVYNGKTYTATEAILTQTGHYMLYDKSKSVLFENLENSPSAETADTGAFAYFTLRNGELVPCMLRTKPKIDPETGKVLTDSKGKIIEVKYFEVLEEYAKENGAYVFTENDNPFMATMGPLTKKAQIGDNTVKLTVTDQGYYIDTQEKGIKRYYQKTSDGKYVLKYSVEEIDGIVKYYSYDSSNNKTILEIDNIESLVGEIVNISTGQFLAGESNVEYEFYRGTLTNKSTLETLTGLISEMIIKNPESFIYNALDKGINERLGELRGAFNIERIVNIRFDNSQEFANMFGVIERDGKKLLAAKNRAGEIYLDAISKYNKSYSQSGVKILFEGYSVEDVITIEQQSQQSISENTIVETAPMQMAPKGQTIAEVAPLSAEEVNQKIDSILGTNTTVDTTIDLQIEGLEITLNDIVNIAKTDINNIVNSINSKLSSLKTQIFNGINTLSNEVKVKTVEKLNTIKTQFINSLRTTKQKIDSNFVGIIERINELIGRLQLNLAGENPLNLYEGAIDLTINIGEQNGVFNNELDVVKYFGDCKLYLVYLLAQNRQEFGLSFDEFRSLRNKLSKNDTESINYMLSKISKEEAATYYQLRDNKSSLFNTWVNSLTEIEKSMIRDYTQRFGCVDKYDALEMYGYESLYSYVTITELMRAGVMNGIEEIDTALEKAGKLANELTTFRGVGLDALTSQFGEIDLNNLESLIGRVYEDKAYMSTSLLERNARSAVGKPTDVILKIKVPTDANYGAFIESISELGYGQMEFLIKKNSSSIIENAFINEDGKLVVEMKLFNKETLNENQRAEVTNPVNAINELAPRQATPSVVDVATSARTALTEQIRTMSAEEFISQRANIIETLNQMSGTELVEFIKSIQSNAVISNLILQNTNAAYMETLTSTMLAQAMDYYESAAKYGKTAKDFISYRTHTEGHVREVAESTVKTAMAMMKTLKNTAYANNVSLYELYVASLWHDVGMAAGEAGILGINSNINKDAGTFNPELLVDTSGNITRGNHTLNSALAILQNAELIRKLGVNPSKIALIVFAHSKSNSGLKNLTQDASYQLGINLLTACIEKYNELAMERNASITDPSQRFKIIDFGEGKNYIDSLMEIGLIDSYETREAYDNVNSKNYKYVIHFNQEAIKSIATMSLALRLGDANTTNERLDINQAGELISFILGTVNITETDYHEAFTAWKQTLPEEKRAKVKIDDYLLTLVVQEAGDANIRIGGKTFEELKLQGKGMLFAYAYILGEANLRMSVSEDSGIYDVLEVCEVKNGNISPAATLFNIIERAGEIISGIPSNTSSERPPFGKIQIKLPSNTEQRIVYLYNSVRDLITTEGLEVEVIVEETTTLGKLSTEEFINELATMSDNNYQVFKDEIASRLGEMSQEDLIKLQTVVTNPEILNLIESKVNQAQSTPPIVEIVPMGRVETQPSIEDRISQIATMSREELIELYKVEVDPVILQEIESKLVTYNITILGLKQYLHTLGVKIGLLTDSQIKNIEQCYKMINKWKAEISNLEHYASMYGSAVKAQIPRYRQWIEEEYAEIQHIIDSVRTETGYKGYISYKEFLKNNEQVRKAWEATLTEEEWNLLKGYKSESDVVPGSYSAINTLLRMSAEQIVNIENKTITFRHTGNRLETYTFEEIERKTGLTISKYIESINSAAKKLDEIIRRSSLAENMTLYRGISKEALISDFGIDIYNDSESEILAKLNGIYSDKGFMSTSATMNSEFFDNSEVVLILNCAQGTPAIDLSSINADEQEVLLSYGQKFKVEKVEKVDVEGKVKVYIYLTTA